MAIKIVSAKNLDWGKGSYLTYSKIITTKAKAIKEAKKYEKFYKDIMIVPEISYGMKRPHSYTLIGMGLLK